MPMAFFIKELLKGFHRTEDAVFLQEATALAGWLLTQQCDRKDWKHSCWGYHFGISSHQQSWFSA